MPKIIFHHLIVSLFTGSLIVACSEKTEEQPTAPSTLINIKNPGFEMSESLPEGWTLTQHTGAAAYEGSIDKKTFTEGKQSFKITRISEQFWGMLSQHIDLPGMTGKKLTLTAMVKSDALKPKGFNLSLHFRKRSGKFISEVKSELLTGDTDWHQIKFDAVVPDNTSTLQIAATLLDEGSVWLDNIKIAVEK